MQLHLQNIWVKFMCEGHRVKVKVTAATRLIRAYICGLSLIERQSCFIWCYCAPYGLLQSILLALHMDVVHVLCIFSVTLRETHLAYVVGWCVHSPSGPKGQSPTSSWRTLSHHSYDTRRLSSTSSQSSLTTVPLHNGNIHSRCEKGAF